MQIVNLVQISRMKVSCNNSVCALSAVLVTVALLLSSFIAIIPVCSLPEVPTVSGMDVYLSSGNSYDTPEFSQKVDSVVIPLKRAGRLFLIEAQIDGESGNLVFDSGANGLVLNSTYFRNHVKWGGKASNSVTGSVGVVDQVSVEHLQFADLKYSNLVADLANLGHIENRRGAKILGLVGFSLLRSFEVVFDPSHAELKLFSIDKTGQRINSFSGKFKTDYVAKIEGSSNILFLKGNVGGRVLNFCIDTGAETNALSSELNKKVMNTVIITRRTTLKGVAGNSTDVLYGRMNDFAVGSQKITGMETVITNLESLSEAYGTHIDGMLGVCFLEHGIFCVNFINGQFGMRFTKGEPK
jgi:predicted aspartyl protease